MSLAASDKVRRTHMGRATVQGAQSRRAFVSALLIGGGVAFARPASLLGSSPFVRRPFLETLAEFDSDWDEVPHILARIKPPIFANREFDITKFGAVGDNQMDCTDAFAKAIAACNRSGGGKVVVPKGEFLTGAVRSRSNVNLQVSAGATIRFTRDRTSIRSCSRETEGSR